MYKRKKVKAMRWEEKLLAAGILIFAVVVTVVNYAGQIPAFWKSDASESADGAIEKIVVPVEQIEVTTRESDKRTAKGNIYEGIVKQLEQSDETVPLIMLDPGHGGVDGGCVETNITEKNVNLRIALLTKDKLEEKGFRVLLTREKDDYLTIEDRAKFANQMGADAFVSIHQNTFEDAEIYGLETWFDGTDKKRESGRLAQLVHEQTLLSTGAREREIHGDADFHVTSNTQMPSCLIETGFLSNPEERGNLTDISYQEKIAEGIAKGIDLFFHP